MKTPQKNSSWNIIEGKLIQHYALLTGDESAYQYGKECELKGRFRKQMERKQGIRRMPGKAFLAALLCLVIANAASAQPGERSPGSLSIGPQAGYFKSKGADDAKVMWGGAARLKVGGALGIEASVNYRTEEYENGAISVKSWPVMVTGLLYPVSVLYGAMGIGWYNSAVELRGAPGTASVSETKQAFGWHFGGGVELPVGSAAKIVGDVRYVFLNYDFQKLPGSSAITSDFYVIDVGLLFNL
jgi:hypothetical protein